MIAQPIDGIVAEDSRLTGAPIVPMASPDMQGALPSAQKQPVDEAAKQELLLAWLVALKESCDVPAAAPVAAAGPPPGPAADTSQPPFFLTPQPQQGIGGFARDTPFSLLGTMPPPIAAPLPGAGQPPQHPATDLLQQFLAMPMTPLTDPGPLPFVLGGLPHETPTGAAATAMADAAEAGGAASGEPSGDGDGGMLHIPLWSAADVLPATLGAAGGLPAMLPLPGLDLPLPAGMVLPDGTPAIFRSRAPRSERPAALAVRAAAWWLISVVAALPCPALIPPPLPPHSPLPRPQGSARASCGRAS